MLTLMLTQSRGPTRSTIHRYRYQLFFFILYAKKFTRHSFNHTTGFPYTRLCWNGRRMTIPLRIQQHLLRALRPISRIAPPAQFLGRPATRPVPIFSHRSLIATRTESVVIERNSWRTSFSTSTARLTGP
jgi:hypothetical protein